MSADHRTAGRPATGRPAGLGRTETSGALLRGLLGASPDPIAAVDLDRRYLALNDAYARAFAGAGGGPAPGTRLGEAGGDAEAGVLAAWERALAGEQLTIRRAIGTGAERRAHELAFGPLLDDGGGRIGAFVVGRDLSGARAAAAALRESEARLRFVQEATGIGHWEWDLGSDAVTWSPSLHALFGLDLTETPSRQRFLELVHPEDRAAAGAAAAAAVAGQAPLDLEFRIVRPGGEVRWLLTRARLFVGRDGRRRLVGVNVDVTRRKEAEAARDRQRALLEAVVAQMPLGVVVAEAPSGRLVLLNDAMERILRHPPPAAASVAGYAAYRGFHPDGRPYAPEEWPLARALARGETVAGEEIVYHRGDGSRGIVSVSAAPVRDEAGRVTAAVAVLEDATARKEAEAHQSFLMAELDHRAKNILATIHAIVAVTKDRVQSVGDYTETLLGRIRALARAHELLADDRWEGASLHAILRTELKAYGGAGGRVALAGADARLGRKPAQVLSLALHELATNAAKHGALSAPDGRVSIETVVEECHGGRWLRLSWREAGGPPVAPPRNRGFGSTVIERSIRHELRGEAALEFAPEGVRCEIKIPLAGPSRAPV